MHWGYITLLYLAETFIGVQCHPGLLWQHFLRWMGLFWCPAQLNLWYDEWLHLVDTHLFCQLEEAMSLRLACVNDKVTLSLVWTKKTSMP